jgi:hypothetical protein
LPCVFEAEAVQLHCNVLGQGEQKLFVALVGLLSAQCDAQCCNVLSRQVTQGSEQLGACTHGSAPQVSSLGLALAASCIRVVMVCFNDSSHHHLCALVYRHCPVCTTAGPRVLEVLLTSASNSWHMRLATSLP